MLDLAIHECVRIKDLIHSLQDFNRPTSGKIATLDVHKTIDDLLLFSKKKLKDRKIQVVKKFTAENPQIQGVADQIKQVILNCLNNAEESITRRGGTITIKTELDRDEFLVHISDTGKGIREEEIAYIFDPFYSTKPAVEGTGLGLSVSYGIIKRHGGNISVKSRPGKGSTFTIRLPVDGMLPGEEMPPFFN
jgi:signal transduction histidine kinase